MTKKNELIINSNPKSAFSEAIRTIRTNLQFSTIDNDIKVILNTSPEPGDGKSFISANLAIAYQQEGKKVLIIDCDLRKGRQHEIFKLNNDPSKGYSNLILNYTQGSSLSSSIIQTGIEGLNIIPTGPTPPNPIELLSSSNNWDIIQRLRKRYDIIILDCPPVLGLADTLVMTKYSDANMIVVSNKKTKMELLEKTNKAFDQVNAKITGVIVNKVDFSGDGYGEYYSNGYYKN